MDTIKILIAAYAGAWHGTNRLHDPNTGLPEDSQCLATLHVVLDGLFLRCDYRWTYHAEPQEGSLLIGCERESGKVSAYWIDTWHMGEKLMVLAGNALPEAKLSVQGAYAFPPGPDWGWRIELLPGSEESLQLVMVNISPTGQEQAAVEATLRRVPKLPHH